MINTADITAKTISCLTTIATNAINAPIESDPKQRKPSIALAKEVLQWEPEIQLKDGLLKTIDWFKRNL